jgi:signal transduction histidine kinase
MEELRNISVGLVLPELAELSLAAAIGLAVDRHEGATGNAVTRVIDTDRGPAEVPMMVKVCAYRVVQEALSNAYWHGDGATPKLAATVAKGMLRLEITNGIVGEASSDEGAAANIGIKGMRLRLAALRGRLHFHAGAEGAALLAEIPIDGGEAVQSRSSVGTGLSAS